MSNIWHDINPKRISPDKFMAVIEIPKGCKNKYEMDKDTGRLRCYDCWTFVRFTYINSCILCSKSYCCT